MQSWEMTVVSAATLPLFKVLPHISRHTLRLWHAGDVAMRPRRHIL